MELRRKSLLCDICCHFTLYMGSTNTLLLSSNHLDFDQSKRPMFEENATCQNKKYRLRLDSIRDSRNFLANSSTSGTERRLIRKLKFKNSHFEPVCPGKMLVVALMDEQLKITFLYAILLLFFHCTLYRSGKICVLIGILVTNKVINFTHAIPAIVFGDL